MFTLVTSFHLLIAAIYDKTMENTLLHLHLNSGIPGLNVHNNILLSIYQTQGYI